MTDLARLRRRYNEKFDWWNYFDTSARRIRGRIAHPTPGLDVGPLRKRAQEMEAKAREARAELDRVQEQIDALEDGEKVTKGNTVKTWAAAIGTKLMGRKRG